MEVKFFAFGPNLFAIHDTEVSSSVSNTIPSRADGFHALEMPRRPNPEANEIGECETGFLKCNCSRVSAGAARSVAGKLRSNRDGINRERVFRPGIRRRGEARVRGEMAPRAF